MIACVCLLQGSLAVAGFFALPPENASGPLMLAMASGRGRDVLMLYSAEFPRTALTARRTLANVGGIAQKLPNLAAVFLIATLSLVGIPGLFGFPSLFATLGAVFSGEWTFAFLAIGATLIGGLGALLDAATRGRRQLAIAAARRGRCADRPRVVERGAGGRE